MAAYPSCGICGAAMRDDVPVDHAPGCPQGDKQTPENLRIGAGKPGPGRPKGSVNKITADLKRAILEALEAAGGEEGSVGYLTRQASENPTAFLSLVGKVLPTVHGQDPENPWQPVVVVERQVIGKAPE